MRRLLAVLLLASCAPDYKIPPRPEPPRPFPFVGVLCYGFDPICTVELVDAAVFVTAAHCLDAPGAYTVTFNGVRYIQVQEGSLHPDWEPGSFSDDIAVGRLAVPPGIEPVKFRQVPWSGIMTDAAVVGRSDGPIRFDEGRWIIGKLTDASLILWADPYQFLRHGDSGGALLVDGELVGVNTLSMYEDEWHVSAATDIGAYAEWLNERLGSDPWRLPELPVPCVDEGAEAP